MTSPASKKIQELLGKTIKKLEEFPDPGKRPMYYDRQGRPGGRELIAEWERSRQIAFTELPGRIWVSTVWLCLDHAWHGPPLIFETLAKGPDGWIDDSMRRYSTEEDARRGHEEVCAQLGGGSR